MAPVPFYLDSQFWSAFAAIAALILSQFPPLKQFFKKGKLTIEKYGTLYLSHTIGSPSAHLFILLKNVGGTTVTVQSIDFSVTRKNSDSFLLNGRGYLSNPSDQQFTMLVPFEIVANQTWAHTINFIEPWNRASQKEYKGLYSQIRDSISGSHRLQTVLSEPRQEADAAVYEKLCQFFNKNFKWHEGEYEAEILVKNKAGEIIVKDSVAFTIFESESDELKSWVRDYKFGNGIHLPVSQNQVGVWVELSR